MVKAGPFRIGLLTPWSSRLGGGVFEAVVNHALALRAHGNIEPIVFAGEDHCSAKDLPRFDGIPVHTRKSHGPSVFGFAPGVVSDLLATDLDLLHQHGIWMYPSHCAAAWAARTGKPLIISPHGMLDPWITGRGRWKKAVARLAYEHRNWRRASAFHALTGAEAADIRRELGALRVEPRVEIIANAVTLSAEAAPNGRDEERPYMLYIGRIHRKKNLDSLVAAWTSLGSERSNWRLRIAGWGAPGDVAAFQSILARAGAASVEFLGPVYGEAKRALLSGAKFVVLPSLSEGLPMAILEAWAAATPTLMTQGCNLPEGFEAHAALEIAPTAEAMAPVLRSATALSPAAWAEMSASARHLADTRFSDISIGERWVSLYAELISASRHLETRAG